MIGALIQYPCTPPYLQYTCLVCNLFDDEDKNQYHCDGCGICRIGGKDRFFHCEVCNMCLPMQLKIDGHRVSGKFLFANNNNNQNKLIWLSSVNIKIIMGHSD